MSDPEWDAEDYEPNFPGAVTAPNVSTPDRWEGEDEEDFVKENWDDEDEKAKPEQNGEEPVDAVVKATQVKKKQMHLKKLTEKQAKLEKEKEEKQTEKSNDDVSPEDALAEKLRLQKLQEEADLLLSKELVGDGGDRTGVDAMQPVSAEDFEEFEKALREKILLYEKNVNYPLFLDSLFRDLCAGLEADEIKRLCATLTVLANEKLKQSKPVKSKKKKGARVFMSDATKDFDEPEYDMYDDFM